MFAWHNTQNSRVGRGEIEKVEVMTKVSKSFYRPELDGLRALAILGVLFFHLDITTFKGGFLGVDVFFVMSGFLITRLILLSVNDGTFSFIDFYVRRARRLFPALLATAVLILIAGAILTSPKHFAAMAEAGIFSVMSLANIQSWLSTGYFDNSSVVKPFLHYWSLSVEEQFYLIWPVLLVVCFGLLKRRLGFLVLLMISLTSFAGLIALQDTQYDAVFYLMPFRIWEFGLGAMVVYLSSNFGILSAEGEKLNVRGLAIPSLLTILGVLLIFVSFTYGHKIDHFGGQLFMAALGAALVILAPLNPVSKLLLANPIFVYLGKISYSLYLWHWPVIVYLRYYVGVNLSPPWMVVALLLSLICAALSYTYVENRFRRPWSSNGSQDRLSVPAALTSIALMFVFVASMIWNQNGWLWRVSPDLQKVVKTAADNPRPNCELRDVEGASQRLCIFGDHRETIDVAVIGDSHGTGLAGGMIKYLQEGRLTGVSQTFGGRAPLMNTRRWVVGQGDEGDMNQAFEDVFKAKPEYIVLHARYAFYWNTLGAPNEVHSSQRYLVPLEGPPVLTVESTRGQFRKSLRETLKAIKDQGITPVVVGPIPNPGVDPLQCLSRPPVRTLEFALSFCEGLSQAESKLRNGEVMGVLQSISSEEGALFFDPTDLFCREGRKTCDRVIKEKLVYRDENHLAKLGAGRLGKRVVDMIETDRAASE